MEEERLSKRYTLEMKVDFWGERGGGGEGLTIDYLNCLVSMAMGEGLWLFMFLLMSMCLWIFIKERWWTGSINLQWNLLQ